MPIPSIPELELAASKIVWNARKKGNLKEYTPRLVRKTLEDQFHLEQGTLDAAEYKSAIKAATTAALREDPSGLGEKSPRVDKQTLPVLKKKRKSDGTIKGDDDEKPKSATGSSPKGKGKSKMTKKNEDDEGSLRKKHKTMPQKQKVVSNDDDDDNASSSRPKQRQAQKAKQFKSLEHIPTSDMEQDEPDPQATLTNETSKESPSFNVATNGPASPEKDTVPKISKGKEPVQVAQHGDSPVDDSGAKSESELSVLIDEPPKQKRMSKSKTEGKEAKKPRVKKEAPTLSKDEERIKRLKSFIVACGVRKVWSRLFQGLDTPHQQIKKLEEILAELGMRGRMTMDQAKAIKQKRELAKELEDVQEFAKAVEAKGSVARSRKDDKALRKIESSDSEDEKAESTDDDESDVAPRKRLTNARKSISAFLKDQSSDDE